MKKILVIGSMNMDFVAGVSHIPTLGETVLADNFELVPGGKALISPMPSGKCMEMWLCLGWWDRIHMAKGYVRI